MLIHWHGSINPAQARRINDAKHRFACWSWTSRDTTRHLRASHPMHLRIWSSSWPIDEVGSTYSALLQTIAIPNMTRSTEQFEVEIIKHLVNNFASALSSIPMSTIMRNVTNLKSYAKMNFSKHIIWKWTLVNFNVKTQEHNGSHYSMSTLLIPNWT